MKEFHVFAKLPSIGNIVPFLLFSPPVRNIVSVRRDGLYVLAAPLSAPSIGNSFPFASSRRGQGRE